MLISDQERCVHTTIEPIASPVNVASVLGHDERRFDFMYKVQLNLC